MPLRVISGTAKGRQLKLVPGDRTRPIMDRVKESLFNIIGREIIDATILDLFAGTGSVGIEALSRGASHALFVDTDKLAIKTIYENLKIAKVEELATVRRMNALHLLKQPPQHSFDFIYIAPPQYKELWQETLLALEANPTWIPEETTVIVQIDPKEHKDIQLNHLEEFDRRHYGKTMLWFFRSGFPH